MALGAETTGYVDLHTHTRHSDGELTTAQLVSKALGYGLRALAITDHDSVAAYRQDSDVLELAVQQGLEIIPGIEISTKDDNHTQRHILGYGIDIEHPGFNSFLQGIQDQRADYTRAVCDALQDGGWSIDCNALLAGQGTITKAHIARTLLRDPRNRKLCERYTGTSTPTEGMLIESTIIAGRPFFIPRDAHVTPQEAIDVIHDAGGVAVLAHPSFSIMRGEPADTLCARMARKGIDGFEATYIQYDRSEHDMLYEHRTELEAFCAANNLIATGGSDFHTSDEAKLGKYIDLGFNNHPWKVSYNVVRDIMRRTTLYS